MHDALNNDHFAQAKIHQLVNNFHIKHIIETGTHHGKTTAYFATLGPSVSTIEIDRGYLAIAKQNWHSYTNISPYLGDSRATMMDILPNIVTAQQQPILFFLDAHWGDDHPLLGELDTIAAHRLDHPVLVIHDFQVPGTDLGYDDNGAGIPLSLEYIGECLPAIYPHGYKYEYNSPTTAAGAYRGIIYITAA